MKKHTKKCINTTNTSQSNKPKNITKYCIKSGRVIPLRYEIERNHSSKIELAVGEAIAQVNCGNQPLQQH